MIGTDRLVFLEEIRVLTIDPLLSWSIITKQRIFLHLTENVDMHHDENNNKRRDNKKHTKSRFQTHHSKSLL